MIAYHVIFTANGKEISADYLCYTMEDIFASIVAGIDDLGELGYRVVHANRSGEELYNELTVAPVGEELLAVTLSDNCYASVRKTKSKKVRRAYEAPDYLY